MIFRKQKEKELGKGEASGPGKTGKGSSGNIFR